MQQIFVSQRTATRELRGKRNVTKQEEVLYAIVNMTTNIYYALRYYSNKKKIKIKNNKEKREGRTKVSSKHGNTRRN